MIIHYAPLKRKEHISSFFPPLLFFSSYYSLNLSSIEIAMSLPVKWILKKWQYENYYTRWICCFGDSKIRPSWNPRCSKEHQHIFQSINLECSVKDNLQRFGGIKQNLMILSAQIFKVSMYNIKTSSNI